MFYSNINTIMDSICSCVYELYYYFSNDNIHDIRNHSIIINMLIGPSKNYSKEFNDDDKNKSIDENINKRSSTKTRKNVKITIKNTHRYADFDDCNTIQIEDNNDEYGHFIYFSS